MLCLSRRTMPYLMYDIRPFYCSTGSGEAAAWVGYTGRPRISPGSTHPIARLRRAGTLPALTVSSCQRRN